jgi:hypothetical protein
VRELFPLPPPARRSREELVADIVAGRECGLNQWREVERKLSHRCCSFLGTFGEDSLELRL